MIINITLRIETYRTGSGWEYQVRQSVGHKQTQVPFGCHDSQGLHRTMGEYKTEKDALLASKRNLKKMIDSTIKDLNAKSSILRKFAN